MQGGVREGEGGKEQEEGLQGCLRVAAGSKWPLLKHGKGPCFKLSSLWWCK